MNHSSPPYNKNHESKNGFDSICLPVSEHFCVVRLLFQTLLPQWELGTVLNTDSQLSLNHMNPEAGALGQKKSKKTKLTRNKTS